MSIDYSFSSSTSCREADYDSNPTKLYTLIESKKFKDAILRSSTHPLEVSTWIVKSEKNNQIKWRLLPLHAAILFRSESLIKQLLHVYPEGAYQKDDQGMTALHLAFRFNASESIVNKILALDDEGREGVDRMMNAKDHKGRTPLDLIKPSSSSGGSSSNRFREFTVSLFHQANHNNDTENESSNNEHLKEILVLQQKLLAANTRLAEYANSEENARDNDIDNETTEDLHDRIDELETELENQRENFNRTVTMYEKRSTLHKAEISVVNEKLSSVTEENENLSNMYTQMQDKYTKDVESMKKKQNKLRADHLNTKTKMKEFSETIDLMEKEKQESITSIEEQTKLVTFLENHIASQQDEIQKLKNEFESLKAKSNEMEQGYNEERAQKETLAEELSKSEALAEELKVQNSMSEKTITELSDGITDRDDKIHMLKGIVSQLNLDITNTKSQNKKISSDIVRIRTEAEVEKCAHDNELKNFEQDHQILRKKNTELAATIVKLKETCVEQHDDLDLTRKKLDNLGKDYTAMEEAKSGLERKSQYVQSQCDEYERRVETLTKELDAMTTKNKDIQMKCETIQSNFVLDRKHIEDDLLRTKNQLAELSLEHKKTQRDYDDLKSNSEKQVESLLNMIEQTNEMHSNLAEKYNDLKKLFDSSIKKNADTKKNLMKEKENELDSCKAELEGLRQKLSTQESTNKLLEKKLIELEDQNEQDKLTHVEELEAFEQKLKNALGNFITMGQDNQEQYAVEEY